MTLVNIYNLYLVSHQDFLFIHVLLLNKLFGSCIYIYMYNLYYPQNLNKSFNNFQRHYHYLNNV